MAHLVVNSTSRDAWATSIRTVWDSGGAAGLMRVYGGTQPINGGALSGNTLGGTLTMSYPCGTVTAGSGALTLGTITGDAVADNDVTATFARALASNGTTFVFDVPIMSAAAYAALTQDEKDLLGFVLTLNSVNIIAGGQINPSGSFVLTEGNG